MTTMTLLETTPSTSLYGAPHAGYPCLVFRVGEVEYGMDILQVQEIRSYATPTRIANAPPELLGALHLRGAIVPVIDARLKFQVATADCTASTVVMVLNLQDRMLGVVVDAVSDVVHLAPADIHPAPKVYAQMDACWMKGLAQIGDRMLILVDPACFLGTSVPECGLLAAA